MNNDKEVKEYIGTHKREIADELADVFNWVLLFSHELGINIVEASLRKLKLNRKKYPIKKAKGRHTKYNNL